MTLKGFLKGGFKTGLIAAAIAGAVYAPLVLLAVVASAVVAKVTGTVVEKAVTSLMQAFRLGKSNKQHPAGKGERLTAGEAAFAESILGKKMQPERIKKYLSATENNNGAETYGPNSVKFFGAGNHEADYSKAQNVANAGLFMREMAHAFQRQDQGVLTRAFKGVFRTSKSEYTLTPKSRFERFGNNQQAAVLEDYALQFIYRKDEGAELRASDQYTTTHNSVQNLSSLKKVVETRFPQARRTRLAVETQQRRHGTPVKSEVVHFPVVVH